MRVVHLSTDAGIAFGGTKGAAVHLEELATALAEAGAEVLVLVASASRDRVPEVEGIEVEVLPGAGKDVTTRERLAADTGLAAWLEERLGDFGADVLYERVALHSSAGAGAVHALAIPHLVELNAPLPAEATRYRVLEHGAEADLHELRTLSGASAVLAVSSPLAEYARARGARHVGVLPNAVDPDRFFPVERPGSGEPVAVFSGSLRPWHGIDCLAEAWTILGNAAPPLLVVGDGPGREVLEAVGARVTGAVSHADVPRLVASAGIALAPYACDAPDYFSPLKLLEYLAAGLPTIAGNLPGVCDVVDAKTAVLVPRGDARALAEATAELASDPARRRSLGEAGRALVVARHTWAHRARTVLELAAALRGRAATPTGVVS